MLPFLIDIMEYNEIVAVTGLSGLYQLLTTKSDGAIVRNLEDKSTKFISARLHNVTPLESIEIYTTGDNVRLHNVLQKMKDSEGTTPIVDAKKADNDAVKAYFLSIFPELDEERVYVSDMKKMVKWYALLKANDLLTFEEPEETATEEDTDEAPKAPKKKATADTEAEAAEKPVKKAAAKKAAPKKAEAAKKPAKKAATKKAATKSQEKGAKKAAPQKKKG